MKYLLLLLITLSTACSTKPGRDYVSIGDSITADGYVWASYTIKVASHFSLSRTNLGVGGMKLENLDLDLIVNNAPIHKGTIVTFMVVYNDMRFAGTDQNYISDAMGRLKTFLTSLTQRGAIVYVGNCLRMQPQWYNQYSDYSHGSDQAVDAWNTNIQAVSSQIPNTFVVDVSHSFNRDDASLWEADGIHPNTKGQNVIADIFIQSMGGL